MLFYRQQSSQYCRGRANVDIVNDKVSCCYSELHALQHTFQATNEVPLRLVFIISGIRGMTGWWVDSDDVTAFFRMSYCIIICTYSYTRALFIYPLHLRCSFDRSFVVHPYIHRLPARSPSHPLFHCPTRQQISHSFTPLIISSITLSVTQPTDRPADRQND